MASLTIRNLSEDVKTRLRVKAAGHGISMEEQARRILSDATGFETESRSEPHIVETIRERFVALGGVELEEMPAEPLTENMARAIAALTDPIGGVELDVPARSMSRPPSFDDRTSSWDGDRL